jgi:hypothetical protein
MQMALAYEVPMNNKSARGQTGVDSPIVWSREVLGWNMGCFGGGGEGRGVTSNTIGMRRQDKTNSYIHYSYFENKIDQGWT